MTKKDAIMEILYQATNKNSRISVASYMRIKKAMLTLGLTEPEARAVMSHDGLYFYDWEGRAHPAIRKVLEKMAEIAVLKEPDAPGEIS